MSLLVPLFIFKEDNEDEEDEEGNDEVDDDEDGEMSCSNTSSSTGVEIDFVGLAFPTPPPLRISLPPLTQLLLFAIATASVACAVVEETVMEVVVMGFLQSFL